MTRHEKYGQILDIVIDIREEIAQDIKNSFMKGAKYSIPYGYDKELEVLDGITAAVFRLFGYEKSDDAIKCVIGSKEYEMSVNKEDITDAALIWLKDVVDTAKISCDNALPDKCSKDIPAFQNEEEPYENTVTSASYNKEDDKALSKEEAKEMLEDTMCEAKLKEAEEELTEKTEETDETDFSRFLDNDHISSTRNEREHEDSVLKDHEDDNTDDGFTDVGEDEETPFEAEDSADDVKEAASEEELDTLVRKHRMPVNKETVPHKDDKDDLFDIMNRINSDNERNDEESVTEPVKQREITATVIGEEVDIKDEADFFENFKEVPALNKNDFVFDRYKLVATKEGLDRSDKVDLFVAPLEVLTPGTPNIPILVFAQTKDTYVTASSYDTLGDNSLVKVKLNAEKENEYELLIRGSCSDEGVFISYVMSAGNESDEIEEVSCTHGNRSGKCNDNHVTLKRLGNCIDIFPLSLDYEKAPEYVACVQNKEFVDYYVIAHTTGELKASCYDENNENIYDIAVEWIEDTLTADVEDEPSE